MPKQLQGNSVAIRVSDPWDFGTVVGVGPYGGKIVLTGTITPTAGWGQKLAALIRLDSPLTFQGMKYEYIVASPRHEDDDIAVLNQGKRVHCSMLRLPVERAESGNPFDLNWWRGGGGGLIGTIEPLEKQKDGT